MPHHFVCVETLGLPYLRLFANDVQSTAGFKPALEQMEVEAYGAVKMGALDLRVRSLSLEFSAGL